MRKIKRIKKLLHTAMIFVSVYSVSILFMPLASDLSSKTHRISTIILGLIFWVSVVVAYSSMFMANKKRKELGYEKHSKNRLGIFSFFSNVLATVVDFLLFVKIYYLIAQKVQMDSEENEEAEIEGNNRYNGEEEEMPNEQNQNVESVEEQQQSEQQ